MGECRCGRETLAVEGSEGVTTCSLCGYTPSFCKCKPAEPARLGLSRFRFSADRTKSAAGAAVLASLGTVFGVTLLSSPLLAFLGMGPGLAVSSGIFLQWLKGAGTREL